MRRSGGGSASGLARWRGLLLLGLRFAALRFAALRFAALRFAALRFAALGFRGGLGIVTRFRRGLRSAGLEVRGVPAAALQLETGGAQQLRKRGLPALRARRER